MKHVLALLPGLAVLLPFAACAGYAKDGSSTGLGTSWISDPVPPENRDSAWSGSYVYFGAYDGSPIRFRVPERASTAYTAEKALFPDRDAALSDDDFDCTEPYSDPRHGNSIQAILNGQFPEGFDAPESLPDIDEPE